jgi:methyl-accepting chemotaxis protein
MPPMLVHEMESLLRNVDARLARVEQILPTLASQERVDANHRHMLVLHEDLKGDIRLLAEHLSDQMQRLSGVSDRLSDVSDRVSGLSDRLSDVSNRVSDVSGRLSEMSERLADMSDILRRLDRGR